MARQIMKEVSFLLDRGLVKRSCCESSLLSDVEKVFRSRVAAVPIGSGEKNKSRLLLPSAGRKAHEHMIGR